MSQQLEALLALIEMQATQAKLVVAGNKAVVEKIDKLERKLTSSRNIPDVPNTLYKGAKLPTSLVDPRTIPQTDSDIRANCNNAVRTVAQWWNLNTWDIWQAAYIDVGNRTGWHVRTNLQMYFARNRDKNHLNLFCALGRDIDLAEALYSLFGQQQPFQMPLDERHSRNVNFTAIGRKKGQTYPWQDPSYIKPLINRKKANKVADVRAEEKLSDAGKTAMQEAEKAQYASSKFKQSDAEVALKKLSVTKDKAYNTTQRDSSAWKDLQENK